MKGAASCRPSPFLSWARRLTGTSTPVSEELPFPICDCHTHLLPGLDDGPASWEEAVELVREAWLAGTRALVFTPHYLPGSYEPSPALIREKAIELGRRLAERLEVRCPFAGTGGAAAELAAGAGAGDPGQPSPADALLLFPGCEAYLTPELPALLRRGELVTLGDRGTHLLVELPLGEVPSWADRTLFELALAGVTPVLAHPERCAGVRRRPQWLWEAVDRGAMVQVNGESLTGGYGRELARLVSDLIRHGAVHLVGSDAHSKRRPPALREAVARLARVSGEAFARSVAWGTPGALLAVCSG